MDRTQSAIANEQLLASDGSLQHLIRFETLLASLSAHFVNLPADRIDSEIEDAQRRICELLDLDRSSLWQICEEAPGTMKITHLHQPPGNLVPAESMNLRDFFTWAEQKLLGGETRGWPRNRPRCPRSHGGPSGASHSRRGKTGVP
jgi:hypothetical protein